MANKEMIKELIKKLPISEQDKQMLGQRVDTEGEETVKPEIQAILIKAAAQVHAKTEIDSAAKEFNQDVDAVEKEASTFYSQASKLLDQIELDAARSKIK